MTMTRSWMLRGLLVLLAMAGPGVAEVCAQTVEYVHTDALGSVVAITDAAGSVVERNEYEPYGYDLTGAKDGPGYTGHVSDAATGLSYMQQRYYDPAIGRFLSVDPVTTEGGDMRHFNRYAYAYSNPYNFTDPDGRQSKQTQSEIETLVTGIDSGSTKPTMSANQRIVSGVLGAVDTAIGLTGLAGDAFGAAVAIASPADGPVLDVGFTLKAAKDGMQTVDGMRGVMSALDGKERPSTLEQAGGAYFGEQGAAAGKTIGTVLTVQAGAKALANPSGALENLTDAVRPILENATQRSDPGSKEVKP